MSTIVIDQVKVELDFDQLIRAILSLDAHDRALVRKALDQNWTQELDEVLAQVYARFQSDPMSDDEIAAEVEAARAERYASRHRS